MSDFKALGEFKLELQSGDAQFRSQSAIFCSVWTWNLIDDLEKTIGHLLYTSSSLVHHFKAMGEFKHELHSRNAQFRSKLEIFCPVWLIIWRMTLENNRALLLCCLKLCASFHNREWIQTGVTVRKCPIRVKIDDVFVLHHLEILQMTLKNNRESLLCYSKLCVSVASFCSHWLIQTRVTVRKRPIWVKIDHCFSRVTLKFDGWP